MSVKCRAKHAQPTDEHWWQNRNIRVNAILLHLEQQKRAINALQHYNQNAFNQLIIIVNMQVGETVVIQDRCGMNCLYVCYKRITKVEYMIT